MKTQNNILGKYCKIRVKAKTFFGLVGYFLLVTLFLGLFQINQANAEDNFFIKKGSEYELCRELNQVLNSEENKDYPIPYISYSEFNIPKRFKNFNLLKWQDIAMEDLSKYMKDSDEIWKAIKKNGYGENLKGYKLQKTTIDFDHDGKKEDIIRFVYQDENGKEFRSNRKDTRNYRFSYVSDINGDTSLSKGFNGPKEYPNGSNYFMFFYKGKVYRFYAVSSITGVSEPKLLKSYNIPPKPDEFWTEEVCIINLVSEKQKKADKSFWHDSDSQWLERAEERQKNNPTQKRAELILKAKERLKSYKEQ